VSEDQAPLARIKWVTLWLLAGFLLASAFTRKPENALASAAGIAIAVPAAAIAITQRTRPRIAVAFYLAAGVGVVLDAGGSHASLGYFGLCILALLCILTAGPRPGHVFAAAAIVLLFVRLADSSFSTGWLPWISGVFVSALGGGVLVHEQRLLAQLRAAQADLANRTRLQERARIARELHDVIAHSLTVSLLHISAARMAVQHDPADADRALSEAERLGRESLDEVRAIVGLTRADGNDGSSSLAPTPGLESIDALVERYRSAGAEIKVELGAGIGRVPATIGTTAYRIAQEALTNAARHASGHPVALSLSAPNGTLELVVVSAGPSAQVTARNGGHGLHTMRERAEAVGGALEAGPAPSGDGWRVHATLPLAPPAEWPCGRQR
jgi:signal transduction histidine kinase